ncbi:MAG: YdcF family protein [Corynebacterium sp.]|nr:YdcF family protein [Corynebacterium sp.]
MRLLRTGALSIACTMAALPMSLLVYPLFRPKATSGKYRSIVILGTAQYDGVPSRPFAARLQWAVELWQRNQRLDVVCVGGKLPGDRYSEAAVARLYCLRNRVDPLALIAVPEGNDTASSLEAAFEQIPQPAILVTDPLHALRTKLWAQRIGIQARVSATPYNPNRFPRQNWWKALLHECGGVVVWLIGVCDSERAQHLEYRLRSLDSRFSKRRRHRFEQIWQHKPVDDAADHLSTDGTASAEGMS